MVNKNQVKWVGEIAEEKLLNIQLYPLTLVTAPIGYGKVVAVQEAISTLGIESIWYSSWLENVMIEEVYHVPTIIVLDCSLLGNLAATQYDVLMQIIHRRIHNLHIVLITRAMPLLPIEALRIKGLCLLVKTEDLRLSEVQIIKLISSYDIQIGRAHV